MRCVPCLPSVSHPLLPAPPGAHPTPWPTSVMQAKKQAVVVDTVGGISVLLHSTAQAFTSTTVGCSKGLSTRADAHTHTHAHAHARTHTHTHVHTHTHTYTHIHTHARTHACTHAHMYARTDAACTGWGQLCGPAPAPGQGQSGSGLQRGSTRGRATRSHLHQFCREWSAPRVCSPRASKRASQLLLPPPINAWLHFLCINAHLHCMLLISLACCAALPPAAAALTCEGKPSQALASTAPPPITVSHEGPVWCGAAAAAHHAVRRGQPAVRYIM